MRLASSLSCLLIASIVVAAPFGNLAKSKPGYYTAKASWPALPKTRVQGAAASGFQNAVAASFNNFVSMCNRDLTDQPTSPYEHVGEVNVTYNSSRLVSGTVMRFEYTGGAHPNTTYQCYSWGMVDGAVKRLRLHDLFKANSKPHDQVAAIVFGKLVKNPQATYVQDGTVRGFTKAQYDQFVVRKDGLEFVFSPYEMGPYASGTITCKVKWSELPALDKTGPLRGIL